MVKQIETKSQCTPSWHTHTHTHTSFFLMQTRLTVQVSRSKEQSGQVCRKPTAISWCCSKRIMIHKVLVKVRMWRISNTLLFFLLCFRGTRRRNCLTTSRRVHGIILKRKHWLAIHVLNNWHFTIQNGSRFVTTAVQLFESILVRYHRDT